MANDNVRRADWRVVDGNLKPLGYEQDGTISGATALPNIPAEARLALVIVTGQDCRWRDDGTDPDASTGMLLKTDTMFWYNGDLSAFKIIETAVSAVLNVSYYG